MIFRVGFHEINSTGFEFFSFLRGHAKKSLFFYFKNRHAKFLKIFRVHSLDQYSLLASGKPAFTINL